MKRGKRNYIRVFIVLFTIFCLFSTYFASTNVQQLNYEEFKHAAIKHTERKLSLFSFERTEVWSSPLSIKGSRKIEPTIKSHLLKKTAMPKPQFEPFYKSDPKRLLIPSLYNGPSNQMIGFHQSILLAIMLNRTIVIPSFYQHALKGERRTIINAEDRFDVKVLSKWVSTITMQEARLICHDKFDAFFQSLDLGESSLLRILIKTELETGIRGLNYKKGVTEKVLRKYIADGTKNVLPLIARHSTSDFGLIGPFYKGERWKENKTLKDILSTYETSAPCVFYCCPFRELKAEPTSKLPVPWPRSEEDIIKDPWRNVIVKEDAGIMLKEIVLHTPPIPLVRHIQKNFINEILTQQNKTGYLAIHWRYDKQDYLKYLCEDHYLERRKDSCDNVRRASNSTAFAQAITNKLLSLHAEGTLITSVYIATPKSLTKFMHEIKKGFEKLHPPRFAKLFNGEDLKRHITRKARYGARAKKDDGFLENIISEVEMEICARSDVFIWSKQSTWSQRAKVKRNVVFSKDNPHGEHAIKMVLNEVDKV